MNGRHESATTALGDDAADDDNVDDDNKDDADDIYIMMKCLSVCL